MYSEPVPGTKSVIVPNSETYFLFCETLFPVKSFTFASIIQRADYVSFIIHLHNYKLFKKNEYGATERNCCMGHPEKPGIDNRRGYGSKQSHFPAVLVSANQCKEINRQPGYSALRHEMKCLWQDYIA